MALRQKVILTNKVAAGSNMQTTAGCGGKEMAEKKVAKVEVVSDVTDVEEAVEATDYALRAFDLCVKEAGLDPGALDVMGVHNWHSNLQSIMSVGLTKLIPKEQMMAVVARKMPNYARTKDCRVLIGYFYEKYQADVGFMNSTLRGINAEAQKPTEDTKEGEEETEIPGTEYKNSSEQASVCAGYEMTVPPEMPPGVAEFEKAFVLPSQKAAAVWVATMAWGVLLTRLRCTIGNVLVEMATILLYVWGNSMVGKSNLTKFVLDWICGKQGERNLETLRGMDTVFEEYYQEVKRRAQSVGKGAKEVPVLPELPVRGLSEDCTAASFLSAFIEARGMGVMLYVPEHDMLTMNGGMASWTKIDARLRIMYDCSFISAKRVSLNAVSGRALASGGCVICGTDSNINKYFRNGQVFTGLSNRFCFLHLKKSEDGKRYYPRQLTKAEQYRIRFLRKKAMDESLHVEEVMNEKGEKDFMIEVLPERNLRLQWLWDYLTTEFEEKESMRGRLNGNDAQEEWPVRCKEVAFRCGMVWYWLWGCKNDDKTRQKLKDACMWACYTMLHGEMELFSNEMNKGIGIELAIPQPGAWDMLGNVFSLEDVERALRRVGRKSQPGSVVNQWTKLAMPGGDIGACVKIGNMYYKRGSEEYEKNMTVKAKENTL